MANILLIAYDNGSHIPFFPQHLYYLYGALQKAGHHCDIWHQDIEHYKSESLTRLLDNVAFDVVGLGFVAGYYQYRKAKEISDAINKSKNRKELLFVVGGHGPAGDPDYFLRCLKADTVVVGDGERAICETAASNKKGIIHGKSMEEEESPVEYLAHLHPDIYRLIRWPTSSREDFCWPMLSSRGCKFSCSFCYRMREGYWLRDVKAIMDEIRYLYRAFHITHFQFSDELLMASAKRTVQICEAILGLSFKIKWDCNGRLNYAIPEVLSLMKRSGCEYINYGIESLDQKILNQMGKGLTLDQIHRGVEATLAHGLSPGLNLLWGFPGDSIQNLRNEVDFLKKYDTCDELRTIRPVTPYPGCPLFRKAVDMGLVKDAEEFYEVKHKNSDLFTVNFMEMPVDDAHRELCVANGDLIDNYMSKRTKQSLDSASRLYLLGDTSFRGFRSV